MQKDPKTIVRIYLVMLAFGLSGSWIDPEKVTISFKSQIPELAELTMYYAHESMWSIFETTKETQPNCKNRDFSRFGEYSTGF